MSDLFNQRTNLVFLGLDFTQARYIGSIGFADPAAIKDKHIESWNRLLVAEPNKFSLQEPFRYSSDKYRTAVDDMVKLNRSVNVAANTMDDPYSFDEAVVKKSVANYSLSGKDGIGVVYVVETLQHFNKIMTVWVTFVDLSSKKVLYTQRLEGKAAGFGFRNFWAGSVAAINKSIASKYYKEWSKSMK